MKRKRSALVLLFIIALHISCKKSNIEYENDFDKSYRSFLSFKKSSNDNYRYTVTTASWVGTRTETIITIKEGKPFQRSYVYQVRKAQNSNELIIQEQWTEELSNLNSHTNGARLYTLDEIYQKAKTDWLLKRENAKTYFEAKNNGLISSAGYVENNCADDCFTGIGIASIEKL